MITEKQSGKKRTFRELERWDIEKPKRRKMKKIDSNNSMISFGARPNSKESDINDQLDYDKKSYDDNTGVKSLKFNSRLL